MGCSSSKPATDEEKQEICKVCAKDMMDIFCIDDALKDPSLIVIKAPPCLDKIKKTSADLKKAAEEMASKADDDEEPPQQEEAAPAAAGLMGAAMGMFSQAKELAADALDKAQELGAKGAAMTLNKIAEGLDEAIEAVEEPMTHIGKDIVTTKKVEVAKTMKEYVAQAPIPNAAKLCMESEPNAISKHLISDATTVIAAKLRLVVDDSIKEHGVIKSWDSAIDAYNACIQKLEQFQKMLEAKELPVPDGFVPEPLKFDVEEYICQSCAEEIGRLMGDAEAKHRDTPEEGATSDVFKKVFKKNKDPEADALTYADFKAVAK